MENRKYRRVLENTGILKYLDIDDHEAAVEELDMHTMKFVNNQIISRQNEKIDSIMIILDGEVKAQKVHGVGSGSMAHMYKDGDIIAYEGVFSGNKAAPMDYFSDGDSHILFINLESFRQSVFRAQLLHGLAGYMAEDSIRKSYRIEITAKKKLRERLLTFLRIRIQETGSNTITLNMTREQLAHELCVNRSALSKELNDMQRDGLITVNKSKITVL